MKKLLTLFLAHLAMFAMATETGTVSYELMINGVTITEINKDDVLSDGGSVTYDPDNKRLVLTNADLQYIGAVDYGGYILFSDNLEINIVGNNSIENSNYFAIELPKSSDLLITGSGSLRVETKSSIHPAIWCNLLTIKDTDVEINAPNFYALGGEYGNSRRLTVDHSYVQLTAGKDGVVQLYRFELLNAEITTPRGAYWDQNTYSFLVFSSPISAGTTVEIRPVATGIEEIMANESSHEARKVLDPETGNVYILHGGKAYTMQGAEVR